jgi:hypothetical protein
MMRIIQHCVTLFLLCGLLLLTAVVEVDATVFNGDVQCNEAQNVCGYHEGKAPDGPFEKCDMFDENCEEVYVGNYVETLLLTHGTGPGQNVFEDCTRKNGCGTGEKIVVEWDQSGVCQSVSTHNGTCSSCSTCGSPSGTWGTNTFMATFSADCTNLANGRNVVCEDLYPVFYPFTAKPCAHLGTGCDGSSDCCHITRCTKLKKKCAYCKTENYRCGNNRDCCDGLKCQGVRGKRKRKCAVR